MNSSADSLVVVVLLLLPPVLVELMNFNGHIPLLCQIKSLQKVDTLSADVYWIQSVVSLITITSDFSLHYSKRLSLDKMKDHHLVLTKNESRDQKCE